MVEIMSNQQIYMIAEELHKAFDNETIYLSAKINFYLQKNLKTFLILAEEIENQRRQVFLNYGEVQEDNQVIIPFDKISIANKELTDLLNIQQEVQYMKLPLSAFGDLELSNKQMQAILFMIEDDTEKKEE